MGKRLIEQLTSDYIEAANRLKPKKSRKRIVAYVESYDDIFFWRTLLSEFENEEYYFQVMLPSSDTLAKGKRTAINNILGNSLGGHMIACVDSDYDYLMQGASNISRRILQSPYIFHTYTYAIENYQCYAESLHQVCVMATLNDRPVVDFVDYLHRYSQIAYPLFLWSIWFYRNHVLNKFSLLDFCEVVKPEHINLQHPESSLQRMQRKVEQKVRFFEHTYAEHVEEVSRLRKGLEPLGVTPETTYLFIQGHHLMDNVVMKLLGPACAVLRREREQEIKMLAMHDTQFQNELTSYQHSQASPEFMLKKNTGYKEAPLYQRIRKDLKKYMEGLSKQA
jgi:hypothetical protein